MTDTEALQLCITVAQRGYAGPSEAQRLASASNEVPRNVAVTWYSQRKRTITLRYCGLLDDTSAYEQWRELVPAGIVELPIRRLEGQCHNGGRRKSATSDRVVRARLGLTHATWYRLPRPERLRLRETVLANDTDTTSSPSKSNSEEGCPSSLIGEVPVSVSLQPIEKTVNTLITRETITSPHETATPPSETVEHYAHCPCPSCVTPERQAVLARARASYLEERTSRRTLLDAVV